MIHSSGRKNTSARSLLVDGLAPYSFPTDLFTADGFAVDLCLWFCIRSRPPGFAAPAARGSQTVPGDCCLHYKLDSLQIRGLS